jgi:peptidylprolyl isomerase
MRAQIIGLLCVSSLLGSGCQAASVTHEETSGGVVHPGDDPAGSQPAAAPVAKPGDLPAPPDVSAIPADAQRTASGLGSRIVVAGTGTEHPRPVDTVEVHYTGWTTDGAMFDSSVKRGQSTKFQLNAVIAGWTEGVQLMVVGETRRFWIPEALAYQGRPGAPGGMLVFDVQLLGIEKQPEPVVVEAPSDVAAPPADAKKTPSGLVSKVITKGTGKIKPAGDAMVEVHYSGWTTDGKMFDSSVARGRPAQFPLNRVIPGWTEGVALMVEGEKRRLWIPEALAYQGRPGPPSGMLVFDVELLRIISPGTGAVAGAVAGAATKVAKIAKVAPTKAAAPQTTPAGQ